MILLVRTIPTKTPPPRRNRPLEEAAAETRRKPAAGLSLGKLRLKAVVLYPLLGLGLLALLALVNSYQENMPVRDLAIRIETGTAPRLLDGTAVREILDPEGTHSLIGSKMASVQLEDLEQTLEAHPMIEKAEVYKNMRGVIHFEIVQREPIARLMNNGGDYLYLDAEGVKFPGSRLGSADVLLVRGDFEEAIADTFACSTIAHALPVYKYIQEDPFWNAQIAEVWIEQSGELVLFPAVGDIRVDFGYPVQIHEKFSNLLDFYRQVLPEVGWDRYRSVSVAYAGQVVARRR